MTRTWVERILALAPRSFRRRYREELLATYEARERVAEAEGRLGTFWIREVAGATWLVIRLRTGLGAFGGPLASNPARGSSALAAPWQDVRFAMRTVVRNPGLSALVVTVLGLGIGADSAVFSAVDAYFFRPLPFTEPDRLVTVFETNPEFGWTDQDAAPANLLDWREQVRAFADVSAYSEFTDQLTTFRDGEPIVVTGTAVVGNFFSTLGVTPELGRTFRFEETWADQANVVVLSHELWVSQFGADPDVVGKTFDIGGKSPEIIGVMPAGFTFPDDRVRLWYPISWAVDARRQTYFRQAHYLRAFARLAPGVTRAEADAELQVVVRRLQEQYTETNSVMGAGITPMRTFLTKDAREPLLVLLGAALLLLLLACVNVANLMLVRASERSREVALRRALGAGPGRIVRQALIEALLLAGAGGAGGLVLGWLGVRALAATTPIGINGATSLTLDVRVLLFTLSTIALSTVIFGAAPALGAVRAGGRRLLDARRGATGRGVRSRTVNALVSLELAAALLLVAGAGLMVRTFWLLVHVDPGFRTEGVLAVQFTVPTAAYPTRDDVSSFYDRFEHALEARPGIESAGAVARLPLAGTNYSSEFRAEGWPPGRTGLEILHRRADRGYFEALEIPLLSGRLPSPDDGPRAPVVVVVNETFAKEYFPNENPIGQRIAYDRVTTPRSVWHEIVGIVGDQRQVSPAERARPEVFESRSQDWSRNNWIVVRGDGPALDVVAAVHSVLKEMDPAIPIAQQRTMASVWGESVTQEEFVLTLLGAFGAIALLLATVGVYSVTSRAARGRTQEIGIRMALGAGGPEVVRLMLRHGLGVVVVGLGAGLAASLLATRALESLLYGVAPTDPWTLGTVVGMLGAVGLAACYLPARRATRVDPVSSLRMD